MNFQFDLFQLIQFLTTFVAIISFIYTLNTKLAILKTEVFHLRLTIENIERAKNNELVKLQADIEKKCDLRHMS